MSVLAGTTAYYRRLIDRGEAPPPGYSVEGIGFCLELRPDGTTARVRDLRDHEQKKPRPRPMPVPRSFKRPGTTPRSFFLWDNSKFALGLTRDKQTGERTRADAHLAAFRALHETALSGSDDPHLAALLAFVLHWNPDRIDDPVFRNKGDDLLDQNIVFSLKGAAAGPGSSFVHETPAAHDAWQHMLDAGAGETRTCLVTGRQAPIARLHPAIKGVWGAQSSGASLVSFNLDAFESYGKTQGENAPVAQAVADGYGIALNALLMPGSGHRFQLADTSVVFWADASHCGEALAAEAESLVGELMDPGTTAAEDKAAERPDHGRKQGDDAGQTYRLAKDTLELIAKGRPVRELKPNLDPDTRFYILGLSPNAARLSVRFWHETTLGPLVDAFGTHWRDLNIVRPRTQADDGPGKQPSAKALISETALRDGSGKARWDTVPKLLEGETMRAILTGGRYPRALLAAVLQRIRADGLISPNRAAICKACLVRDARLSGQPLPSNPKKPEEGPLVSLNRDETDQAYRLGRLFAVLEGIQYAALGQVNATIRDRYFGAASATPASVFPLLLRGANHHLSVLRRNTQTAGLAVMFEKQLGEVIDALPVTLKRHLPLEDQGRFVIGYYHQRNDRRGTEAPAAKPENETPAADAPDHA